MSYVIQNFSKYNKHVVKTPRLINVFLHHSLIIFIFFFKRSHKPFFTSYLDSFFKFFFATGLLNFFYKSSSHLFGNYTNKLTNSVIYWNYKNIERSLYINNKVLPLIIPKNNFFFNLYFFSIKTKQH